MGVLTDGGTHLPYLCKEYGKKDGNSDDHVPEDIPWHGWHRYVKVDTEDLGVRFFCYFLLFFVSCGHFLTLSLDWVLEAVTEAPFFSAGKKVPRKNLKAPRVTDFFHSPFRY